VRLPWAHCQKQAPSESQVLKLAKAAYCAQMAPSPSVCPSSSGDRARADPGRSPAVAAVAAAASTAADGDDSGCGRPYLPGPLLLVPDTSALLHMMGAPAAGRAVLTATPLTLQLLEVGCCSAKQSSLAWEEGPGGCDCACELDGNQRTCGRCSIVPPGMQTES
jgi:hypothetical protein